MRSTTKNSWCFAAIALFVGSLGLGFSPALSQHSERSPQATYRDVVDLARQQELDQLRRIVGRFVSEQADVYVGEIEARHRGEGLTEVRLPTTRVVAALDRSPSEDSRSTAALTIVSPTHGLWLRLSQSSASPAATYSTLLRPLRANAGIVGSCRNCFPELLRRPEWITMDRFMAAGELNDRFSSPFRIEVRGELRRLPPGELRLEDLEALRPDLESYLRDEAEGFSRADGEGVRVVERQIRQRVEPPEDAPPQTRCERVTRYTAERFVDLADLGRFGVRNIRVLGSQICCVDHDDHGGSEVCTREGAR